MQQTSLPCHFFVIAGVLCYVDSDSSSSSLRGLRSSAHTSVSPAFVCLVIGYVPYPLLATCGTSVGSAIWKAPLKKMLAP